MNELKWTLGEPCLRSSRIKHTNNANNANNANNTNIINPMNTTNIPETIMQTNKRELANEKMNERYMISQIAQNPFLSQNTYLEDLDTQAAFLKAKNSNFGS